MFVDTNDMPPGVSGPLKEESGKGNDEAALETCIKPSRCTRDMDLKAVDVHIRLRL
jgi:hypothetical protein